MLEVFIVVALVVVASSFSYLRGQYVGRIETTIKTQILSEIGLALAQTVSEIKDEFDITEMTSEEIEELMDQRMKKKMEEILGEYYLR